MSQKRTYPSGAEKRKKKKVEEEKKCHDKGALLKYFGGTESAQSQSTSSDSTVSDESVLSHTPPSSVPTVPSMSETTADLSTSSTTTSPSHHGPSSAPPVDPAEWPSFLSDSDRTEQLQDPSTLCLAVCQNTPPHAPSASRPGNAAAADCQQSAHLEFIRAVA
ncbi:probable serine/threonine-protein kinase irlA isoform X2 [Entelurus aequoreus]|uniref:probable serine/threonine-protein kinase irlA isoform X2 n=1 Tax=Entelurus aequoreus TaxID=161455 RepID=UPI002B1E8CEA|nr:probable serine/threonine-protein kinase irlA isoform X2 [Entelurus aequoreus]